MKALCGALALFCLTYFIRAEWLVYHHYLVINRDYYPIMREFYGMYAERAAGFAGPLSAILLGLRGQRVAQLMTNQGNHNEL